MTKWMIVYASCSETGGLGSSVAFYNTEEEATKHMKTTYDIIKEDLEGGSIEWDDYEEGKTYSIGGYNKYVYYNRYEAYITKINFKEE